MNRIRPPRLITLVLLAPLAACGDQSAGPADAPQAADARPAADATPDAKPTAQCEAYPVPWIADPTANAAAASELATLSSTANMTWNDNTGTFSTIFQLDLPLPGCTTGQDTNAQVMALVTAHPALFQLDPNEWQVPPFYDCQFVPTDLQILNMGRARLANHAVARDVFAYSLKRVGADVVLTSVIATYVPTAFDGLDAAMTACNDIAPAAAEAAVRAAVLPAHTFELCAPTGDITYTPTAADTVVAVAGDTWAWDEDTGRVLLTGTRTVRVTIDPANYTPELLASDARCPVTDPNSDDFTIGFDVTLDVHTGEILYIKPGLDCIVC